MKTLGETLITHAQKRMDHGKMSSHTLLNNVEWNSASFGIFRSAKKNLMQAECGSARL